MKEIYLMNVHTGSVDTEDNWKLDFERDIEEGIVTKENWKDWSDSLVEVEQDEFEIWVEVK